MGKQGAGRGIQTRPSPARSARRDDGRASRQAGGRDGCESRIGREIAYAFAAAGTRLALTYFRDRKDGEAAAARCRELAAAATDLFFLDLSDDESVREFAGAVVECLGAIDILVNNAGVVRRKPFAEQTFDDIEWHLRVDLEGVLKLTLLCLPHVTEQIIMIGSTAALHGSRRLSTYGAAKWGLRGFTKALASEQPHLRIVAVHPTVTATRMNDFQGRPPEEVARVVLAIARGDLAAENGADVDMREHTAC